MSYLIRRVLAKPRLILGEMCRLYGKFASYLRRVLSKTRLIFPRINGPTVQTCREENAILLVWSPAEKSCRGRTPRGYFKSERENSIWESRGDPQHHPHPVKLTNKGFVLVDKNHNLHTAYFRIKVHI